MNGEAVNLLIQIEEDLTVPKNIRNKIREAISILNGEEEEAIRLDRSLQHLDGMTDDPNVPSYTRAQILNIVSILESNNE